MTNATTAHHSRMNGRALVLPLAVVVSIIGMLITASSGIYAFGQQGGKLDALEKDQVDQAAMSRQIQAGVSKQNRELGELKTAIQGDQKLQKQRYDTIEKQLNLLLAK